MSLADRYDYNGHSLTLKQLADQSGLGVGTIRARLNKGWSVERAIGTLPNQMAICGQSLRRSAWSMRRSNNPYEY
jgi:hypothetical protein